MRAIMFVLISPTYLCLAQIPGRLHLAEEALDLATRDRTRAVARSVGRSPIDRRAWALDAVDRDDRRGPSAWCTTANTGRPG